mgnify:CR=1 FL=1
MLADRHIAHDKRIAIAIGLALMLATYLVFSVRSLLNPVSPGDLLSLKRLITAVLGAGLFLLVAHRASRTLKRGPARIAPVLIYSAISFIALLTIRIAYDLFVAGVTDAVLAANVRWMMSWVGYFGAALATYYALIPARAAVRREAATAPLSQDETVALVVAEVSEWTLAERRELIAALSRIPDYEEADPAARALTAG